MGVARKWSDLCLVPWQGRDKPDRGKTRHPLTPPRAEDSPSCRHSSASIRSPTAQTRRPHKSPPLVATRADLGHSSFLPLLPAKAFAPPRRARSHKRGTPARSTCCTAGQSPRPPRRRRRTPAPRGRKWRAQGVRDAHLGTPAERGSHSLGLSLIHI